MTPTKHPTRPALLSTRGATPAQAQPARHGQSLLHRHGPRRLLALRALGLLSCLALAGPLSGCADLSAVRAFGSTAAALSSYPDVARAYVDSATTAQPYLTPPLSGAQLPDVRQQQAQTALALQATLRSYFATLAQLAGEDSFGLDAEVETIGRGMHSLPPLDTQAVLASANLINILGRYAVLARQESAVRDLLRDGGPDAMKLLERLRIVAHDWRAIVDGDRKTVIDTLDVLTLAKNAQPLPSLLAHDRSAELQRRYADALKTFDTVDAALARIQAAHADMVSHQDHLSGDEIKHLLKNAVSDLNIARRQLSALR